MPRTQLLWTSCRRRHARRDRTREGLEPLPRFATGICQRQKPSHAFRRGQRTRSLSFPQQSSRALDGASWGLRNTRGCVRCPCCDAADVDTRHARVYLSQRRGAGEPASTVLSPRDPPQSKRRAKLKGGSPPRHRNLRGWISSSRKETFATFRTGRILPSPPYLLDVNHTDPQAHRCTCEETEKRAPRPIPWDPWPIPWNA